MDWIKETLGSAAETDQKDLAQYLTEKGYKSPLDALKAGHEAHKLNTRKTEDLRAELEKDLVPGEDWDDEKWGKYIERVRPKDKAAYKAEIPDELKPYLPEEDVNAMIDFFHENGVHPRQANATINKYIQAQQARAAALKAEVEKIRADDAAALDKEWGAEKVKNEELAKRGQGFAAKAAGMEEKPFAELLSAYGLDTHPAFKKLFKFVGEMSNDPKFVSGDGSGGAAAPQKSMGEIMKEEAATGVVE
jgi:hypothetical protein